MAAQDLGGDDPVIIRLPPAHEHQSIFLDWDERHPNAQVLVAPCGVKLGKALHVDTLIPTPAGWTTMGDLDVGDEVFDENGKPTTVIAATEWMYDHTCYEVVFSDGNTIVADAGHLWLTENKLERRAYDRVRHPNDRTLSTTHTPKVRTTEEIRDTLLTTVGGRLGPNHSIRVAGPVEFEARNLPIDPYVLGVWLGDGTTANGSVTIHHNDIEIIQRIESTGWKAVKVPSALTLWRVEGLTAHLRKMGLIGNKVIPPEYLIASIDQRLALLRGLMDTDGTVSRDGECCFDNTNKGLADGVEALAVSLGFKVTRQQRRGRLHGKDHKLCYRVFFITDVQVFHLKRKADRIKTNISPRQRRRTIVAINPVDTVPVKCITVANESCLFLAGKACIPTHNSFGASMWLLKQALANMRTYNVWVAPTLFKARVGYRYMKAMLPDIPLVRPVDGKLEIHLGNGSYIKFIHGRDAEINIEGEAIDAFVIDESGKQNRQLWLSMFTTITQTGGRGIITGSPRGHTWYGELFKMAKGGDPFFCWTQLPTWLSPYVTKEAIDNARRLLPRNLFDQYYGAQFISFSSVFGDLDDVWDDSLPVAKGKAIWIHPDPVERDKDACTGADWAKINDWTVFCTVNSDGKLIGYCRFRGGPYTQQVQRLKKYLDRFKGDMMLEFDKTGVGQAVEDLINEADLDASVNGVTFTNATKQEMVTRASIAFSDGWFTSPRIERVETELTAIEVDVTKTGRHTYAAPEGEHDDVAWALMMAINGAFSSQQADAAEEMIERAMSGTLSKSTRKEENDIINDYADAASSDEDDESDWEDDDFDDAQLDE